MSYKQQKSISHCVGSLWNPRSRSWQILCLVRAHFPIQRCPSFHFVLTWWKETRELFGLLLYRTNPVQQGSILRTWSSPNIPPPKTIALESGFQCTDFGGTQTSVSGSQSSVSQLEFYHRWITTQKAPFLAWQAALRYLNYSVSHKDSVSH